MDEFELIERYFIPLQGGRNDVRLGIGDDAAVLDPGRGLLALAVDTLVCGVHFPADLAPEHIGYRAVAVNLSDFAAMAATPRYATLALTLPDATPAWLERFARGMGEALAPEGIALVGGDTTRGPLTVTVQLAGSFEGMPLRRDGVRPGDVIAVSGTLGDAACGLELADADRAGNAHERWLFERFARPRARLALARAVRPFVHAGIDVSDGLVADVGHLVKRSGCAAEINRDRLPLSPALLACRGRERALALAAGGGDDYELAFSLAPADLEGAVRTAAASGVALTAIGHARAGAGVTLRDADGGEVTSGSGGYRHFT